MRPEGASVQAHVWLETGAAGVRSRALPEATLSGGRNAAARLADVPAATGLVQGLLPRSPADAGEVRALRQPWQAGLHGRIRARSAGAFSPRRFPCRDAPATPAGRAASRARAGFAPPRPGVRPEGPAAPRSPAAERPRPSACTPPPGRPAALGPAHCADACRTVRNASAAVPDAAASAPPRSRRKPTMPCPHGSRTMAHMSHGSGGRAPQASSFPPLLTASFGEWGWGSRPSPCYPLPRGCIISSFPLPLLGLLQAHLWIGKDFSTLLPCAHLRGNAMRIHRCGWPGNACSE